MLRRARSKERAATPRELEVARLIAAGKGTEYSALMLGISRKTLESHLYNLYKKWGIHTRIGLVLALKERG